MTFLHLLSSDALSKLQTMTWKSLDKCAGWLKIMLRNTLWARKCNFHSWNCFKKLLIIFFHLFKKMLNESCWRRNWLTNVTWCVKVRERLEWLLMSDCSKWLYSTVLVQNFPLETLSICTRFTKVQV